MPLLPEDKLIWSPIVVNSRMNRARNASGINSYEQEFKFAPEAFLKTTITQFRRASWLDLCCGQGRALIQTADYFYKLGLQKKIQLKGIDLVDTFQQHDQHDFLTFEARSLIDYIPEQRYDLITCVHGLHYLGDKLKVIEILSNALNSSGLFVANLDLNNIVIKDTKSSAYLKQVFKKYGMSYNSRSKILKQTGPSGIKFGLTHIGSDDTYGPNYTGQDSVTSHYIVL